MDHTDGAPYFFKDLSKGLAIQRSQSRFLPCCQSFSVLFARVSTRDDGDVNGLNASSTEDDLGGKSCTQGAGSRERQPCQALEY